MYVMYDGELSGSKGQSERLNRCEEQGAEELRKFIEEGEERIVKEKRR